MPTNTPPLPRRSFTVLLISLDRVLESWLSGRYWQWRVVWSCLLFSVVHMVVTNPSCLWFYQGFFNTLRAGQEFDSYNTVKGQADTFFTDLGLSHFKAYLYDSQSHMAKMRFRLFLPALVATFRLSSVSLTIWLIQLLLSGVFMLIVTRLAFRLTTDRASSFLFALAISLVYPLRSAWLDMTAYGDFFAYLFLLIAIYTRNPLVVLLSLQAAFWTDERAIPGAGFVLLWHIFTTRNEPTTYRLTGAQVAVLLSGLLYLLLRYWISMQFALPPVDGAFWQEFKSIYYENAKVFGFKVWSGFQGGWLLVGLSALLLVYNHRYVDAVLLLGLLFVTINLSFIVGDVNRAISYSYIALFCALLFLVQFTTRIELRRVLLVLVCSLLISPLPNRLRILNGIPLM
ncbi:hypothetical protein J2I47_24775 [Fibrella sp. HMF5335]|uniref:Uncharacterized protein n=1 Tax=Fibrella rubiginis TaxID=2817060 RepID=A0A939GNN2_9BACT|nr:hypothetical protein [Fibrella rubiginis]MBO0939783.1 hypothetical protein [Fibrella rubiginis]